jgi:hypothetical protein
MFVFLAWPMTTAEETSRCDEVFICCVAFLCIGCVFVNEADDDYSLG